MCKFASQSSSCIPLEEAFYESKDPRRKPCADSATTKSALRVGWERHTHRMFQRHCFSEATKLAQRKAHRKRMDSTFVTRHIIYRFFRREKLFPSPSADFSLRKIFPSSSEKIRIRDEQIAYRPARTAKAKSFSIFLCCKLRKVTLSSMSHRSATIRWCTNRRMCPTNWWTKAAKRQFCENSLRGIHFSFFRFSFERASRALNAERQNRDESTVTIAFRWAESCGWESAESQQSDCEPFHFGRKFSDQ